MNTRGKSAHTTHVPSEQCHSDIAPRTVKSWHEPILVPPFDVVAAVAMPEETLRRSQLGARQPRDLVAVSLCFCMEGVTLRGDGVPRDGHGVPKNGHGVTNGRSRATVSFCLLDAARIGFDWIKADFPNADIMLLVNGVRVNRKSMAEAVVPTTWNNYASVNRWSAMPFLMDSSTLGVGLFLDRATRDRAPQWVWHYLGGRLLRAPSDEAFTRAV